MIVYNPPISVIIPLYNKAAAVESSIRSVLNQSFRDFELIVVDDGSTDGSGEIVKQIQDDRIKFFRQENAGPSKARNTGVLHAKGNWVLFLDADDELLSDALSNFEKVAKDHKEVNFISSSYYIGERESRKLCSSFKEGYVRHPYMWQFLGFFDSRMGATLYKKTLVEECLFNERLRRFEDFEMLLRMYKISKIFSIVQPTMVFNNDCASASKARKDISEDFLGHLVFQGKSFWEKMCLYRLYIENRDLYSDDCRKLYPWLYKRYDYFFLFKIADIVKRTHLLKNVIIRLCA